jgi:dihydroorotase-like cyclic amidohydrolase
MIGRPELAIRNATIVGTRGVRRGDILISGGKVESVTFGPWDGSADRSIDADNLLVFPGMIDTHVHLMDPGDSSRETFGDGTRAAAAAGVTTIIEHTHSAPITSVSTLTDKRAYLRGKSYVDFGLAAHVWPDRIDLLSDLWEEGVSFFKIFTCTTHGVPGLDS